MNIQALLIAIAVSIAVIGGYFWLAPKPEPVGTGDLKRPDVINVQDVFSRPAPQVVFKSLKAVTVELLRPEKRLPTHFRERSHEFLLLVGGEGAGFIGEHPIKAHAGQLMIVPAGVATMLQQRSTEPLQFVNFITPPSVTREYHLVQVGDDLPFGDPSAVAPKNPVPKTARENIEPKLVDLTERFAKGMEQEGKGFKFSIVASGRSGGMALIQVDESIENHKHSRENHIAYVWKGRAHGTIGDQTVEIGPGSLLYIPAGMPHQITKIGDEPLQLVLFSAPPFNAKDIEWLEAK